jgi:hypothetical protein
LKQNSNKKKGWKHFLHKERAEEKSANKLFGVSVASSRDIKKAGHVLAIHLALYESTFLYTVHGRMVG